MGYRPLGVGWAAATASVAALVAGCSGGSAQRTAMPAADAPPAAVVRAYVAALNAHDAHAVRVLSGTAESKAWLDDIEHISDLEVTDVSSERPQWSGQPSGTRVMRVAVRFDLDWELFSDGSMEEGQTRWGYALKRDSTSGRWVIFDEGVA
jgi:hypothetical protein